MSIAKTHGPLIEAGEIDGFTYEVRGNPAPVAYVYREVSGKLYHKETQMGGMTAGGVVRMLISEMPKAAKEAV
ncbi:hypothetical protein HB772_09060 [Sinorhizobium meliloti]|nr:hypothetical protein HB772_09060 [Sinorhizobium meliloti]